MTGRLAEQFYPRRLARAGAHLDGTIASESMTRLTEICGTTVADPLIQLVFGISEFDFPCITGKVAASADIECQRCLESIRVQLAVDIRVAVLWPSDDQNRARAEVAGWSVLELKDEAVLLAKFVEDEVLLELPDYPKHEDLTGSSCQIGDEFMPTRQDVETPFGKLAGLLATLRKTEGPYGKDS